jgi:large subunit ribosomal protein L14e
MYEIGRMCLKIAGRDAGQKCVIVDVMDEYVLIDGMTRRRKCNMIHLEPLNEKIDIAKNASHEEVARAFKDLGMTVKITNKKQKMTRIKATRKSTKKETVIEEKKGTKKKSAKKTEAKKE